MAVFQCNMERNPGSDSLSLDNEARVESIRENSLKHAMGGGLLFYCKQSTIMVCTRMYI